MEKSRKEKEKNTKNKCEKIHSYGIGILFTISMIISYGYLIILNNHPEFRNYHREAITFPWMFFERVGILTVLFEPYFAIIQFAAFYVINKIPVRIIAFIYASFIGIVLLFSAERILTYSFQKLEYTSSLYWIFVLYCISVILYFLFGLYTLLNEDMFEFLKDESLLFWIIPLYIKKEDEKGKGLLNKNISPYVVVYFIITILVYHWLKPF